MKTNITSSKRLALTALPLALVAAAGAFGACTAEFEVECPAGTVQTAGGGDVGDACTPVGGQGAGGAGAPGGGAGAGGAPSAGSGGGGGLLPIPDGGVCQPNDTKCEGDAQQTCDAAGQWGAAAACDIACDAAGKACVVPVQLAVGVAHACARLSDHTVRCWGSGVSGQLGNGTGEEQLIPKLVPGLTDVVGVDAAFFASCARLSNGTASCWGKNDAKQLQSSVGSVMTPASLGLQGVKQVSLALDSTCILNEQNLVFCKGAGFYGQLGNTDEAGNPGVDSDIFVPILSPTSSPLPSVLQTSSAPRTKFAVTANGAVLCWGEDEDNVGEDGLCAGQGANDNFGGTNIAGRPLSLPQVSSIRSAVGGNESNSVNACAVRVDGKVLCWGRNDFGQLGRGTRTDGERPGLVSGLESARQAALGGRHACAVTSDNKLFCWGSNSNGQLGGTCGPALPCQTDPDSQSFVPIPTQVLTDVVEVRAGGAFTCALSADAKVMCWGSNTSGQLGNGAKGGAETTPKPVVWK